MYHLKDSKLLFLAHPRTASHSIREALKEAGARMVGGHHWPLQELVASNYNGIAQKGPWPPPSDFFVLCTVRNPFDALCSWAAYYGVTPTGQAGDIIEECLQKDYFHRGKGTRVTMYPFAHYATHVMRFESLTNEWNWLRHHLKLTQAPAALDHLTRRQPKEKPAHYWRNMWNEEDRALIENRCAVELSQYRYAW